MGRAPTSLTHWGAFTASVAEGEITAGAWYDPLPPVRAHQPPVIR